MTLVVGLGKTGLACARYLVARGVPVALADSRADPPGLAEVRREFPGVPLSLGGFDARTFARYPRLVVSPGVALVEPAIAAARAAGSEVIGDIELFVRAARAPIVAITGSNGKSTVTTLVAEMLRAAGRRALAGANLGPPALDLLQQAPPDYYVLELSSFQLEALESLRARVAVVLNVSPDHQDRYPGEDEYAAAKARIYRGARHCVFNADDQATCRGLPGDADLTSFTLAEPGPGQFGVRRLDGERWLAEGRQPLMPVADLALAGEHNLANALAALAIVSALGIDCAGLTATLRGFAGLAHRMQPLGERAGVLWVNDSKATNVGATVAALQGAGRPVVLIAGGDGKGADFTPLRAAVSGRARAVVLIGRDAAAIAAALGDAAPVEFAAGMEEAVSRAAGLARPGDMVLLAPACASFDMFRDYRARGEAFALAVQELDA